MSLPDQTLFTGAEAALRIADNLLERAKVNVGELYWDPGSLAKSPIERRIQELSLGFGTPGILLFLAECYQRTQDERLLGYIDAAAPRMRKLFGKGAARPGFFVGTLGALYAFQEVRRLTGISVLGDQHGIVLNAALLSLRELEAPESPGVSSGTAGSLLGLELCSSLAEPDLVRGVREAFLSRLVSQARAAEAGLSFGRYYDAIKSPVGFYSGQAGIRYVLTQYAATNEAVRWLVAQMDRYENSAYSEECGNWKDFIHESYFNGTEHAHALNRAVATRRVEAFERWGDTVGWGAGAAGILVGHTTRVPGLENDDETAQRRAIQRIDRAVSRIDEAEDQFTLYDGWGGVALSLASSTHAAARPSLERIVEAARAQYERRGRFKTCAWNEASRLGLLVGEAGVGYFLLRAADPQGQSTLLAPRPERAAPPCGSLGAEKLQRAVVLSSYPLTAESIGPELVHPLENVSFVSLTQLVKKRVEQKQDATAAAVLEYEETRNSLERSVPSCLYLASREGYLEQIYTATFQTASDDALLGSRVRRVPETRLGVVPFVLPAPGEQSVRSDGSTALLLHLCSDGVREIPLSPEAYAVLLQLERGVLVRDLVARVSAEWPLNQYSEAKARTIILDVMRSGLAAGYLERADN
jgi:lantibiotic modifying enzyme